jgi:predicted regulator of Ras-like GTPase activity (Roadblock/LC7/MglB family)
LRTVIAKLSPELAARVRHNDVGEAEVFVPMQKVLSQLPTGAVRLSFGELRLAAPPGTFSPENDRDRTMVDLPLAEVLSRLNPGIIARRSGQKIVEIPPEITGPFSGQTRVTISTTPSLKPAEAARPIPVTHDTAFKRNGAPVSPAVPVPAARPAPAKPSAAPVPEPVAEQPVFQRAAQPAAAPIKTVTPIAPAAPVRSTVPLAPEPVAEQPVFRRAAPAQPASPVISPIVPTAPPSAAPGSPSDPDAIPISPIFHSPATAKPAVPQPPVEEPAPIRFNPVSMPAPAAAQPAPSAPVAFAPAAPQETRFISIPLGDISQTWPDPVKKEVDQINRPGTVVALPFGVVEAAMKAGKLAFPWSLVRSWIRPAVAPGVSAHDAVLLELSLRLVTPLFMAEMRAPKAAKKLTVADEIPDLFSNGSPRPQPQVQPQPQPQPQPLMPTATPPAQSTVPAVVNITPDSKSFETNYYQKDEAQNNPNDPALQVKDAKIGTSFLQRYATPNDIVAKASALPGIGGSLIALPDGLLVASKVPADMNADTLAGFLPAIFSKVSQTTKELRMGELNNLNFTVGNIPWKIFRVGAIYFAAFGVAGKPMPTAQLAGLAAELDRKPKQ